MKYKDPISGNIVEFDLIDIDKLTIPDFQRKFSPSLASKISLSMKSVNYFTAPVVVVKKDDKYIVVDGQHRVRAAESLGLQKVPCVIFDDPHVIESIMKLNTERPPNIREQSEQARKIYLDIYSRLPNVPEEDLVVTIPEPFLVTCGFALEKDPKFSPSAFEVLSAADYFFEDPLKDAIAKRKERADKVLDLFDVVCSKEAELLSDGLKEHQFLKKLIVSRANPYKRRRGSSLPDFDTFVKELKERIKDLSVEDFSPAESVPV